jgi:hypothetical protein
MMSQYEQQSLALYQDEILRNQQDRKLHNMVMILQGFAALVTIISFIALARKK